MSARAPRPFRSTLPRRREPVLVHLSVDWPMGGPACGVRSARYQTTTRPEQVTCSDCRSKES